MSTTVEPAQCVGKQHTLISLGELCHITWGNTSITKASYSESGFVAYSASGPDGFLPTYDYDQSAIVLSAIGARCGKCFFATGKWTAIKNTIVIYPKRPDAIDLRFLFHFLNREQLWPTDAMVQPFITMAGASSVLVPWLPISEQRRIAELLDKQVAALQRARAAAEAQLRAANILLQRYMHSAFCGIMPLTASGGHHQAPKGWRWVTLTDIAQLESGHTPSRYHPEWWGGEIPWLALPDIRALDGRVAYETIEYTNQDGLANSSARLLPANTVCLSRTASVGFVTTMGRPMATSQDFVNWICGPELHPPLLAFLLRAAREYIRSLSSGAVHKTVYMPTVKAFQVCIPKLGEQLRIANELQVRQQAVEKMQGAMLEQTGAIELMPASLLHRAFAGRL